MVYVQSTPTGAVQLKPTELAMLDYKTNRMRSFKKPTPFFDKYFVQLMMVIAVAALLSGGVPSLGGI